MSIAGAETIIESAQHSFRCDSRHSYPKDEVRLRHPPSFSSSMNYDETWTLSHGVLESSFSISVNPRECAHDGNYTMSHLERWLALDVRMTYSLSFLANRSVAAR